MSDYRAIAGVTSALQQFLHGPASLAVPGTSVRSGPPTNGQLAGAPGLINIFLYQVTPNAHFRNADLPTRRSDGSLIRRPQAALDLSYLISFYGEESKMVPQLLLGATVAALHARPTLSRGDIPESLNDRSLADSGIFEQAQLAQFRPVPLSHEELSRIWSVFFQVPYALSVAYTCSVVLIEADLTPEPALPVQTVRARPWPAGRPRLDRVVPPALEPGRGASLRLEGAGLGTRGLAIRFGDVDVLPRQIDDSAVEVEPPSDLTPGAQTVVAVRPTSGERLDSPLVHSEPLAFVLLPRIEGPIETAGEADARRLTVRSVSPIGRDQRVELLLNEVPSPAGRRPRAVRLRARRREGDGHELEFVGGDLTPGAYLARLEVDGIAGHLDYEDDAERPAEGRFVGPTVEIR